MRKLSRPLRAMMYGFFGLLGLISVAILASYIYIAPNLPPIEALRDMRLQVPLRVYTQDGKLISEFGKMKRTPVKFYEMPDLMIKAILAAEDDRFFEHPGVDYHGILRAGFNLVRTGRKTQGGSTITMQVARNFFLSREKTYLRKLSEIFLALKIERELSKEDILELYLNKIYLGNRAYGVAAAAQIYYGTTIDRLSMSQMAMIAGLPKAPSRYNPIADRERATVRRNYVLGRMRALGFIDENSYQLALAETDQAELHSLKIEVNAPYVAEMVRETMVKLYGDEAYTNGYQVYTTLDSRLQIKAQDALRQALQDYDQRHGYRGPAKHIDLTTLSQQAKWSAVFNGVVKVADLEPALVLSLDEQDAMLVNADEQLIHLPWTGISWAQRYIDDNRLGNPPAAAADVLTPGDIVYLKQTSRHQWRLAQIPQIEGAIVSLNPNNGSVIALSGGYDFFYSKFNRATQATRQPGSSFKPFIYSAALDKGFTAASIINDAPVVFDDPGLESAWRPENYSGKFFGPTRMRVALMKSRNLVSIRLLRAIGVNDTLDYIARFGFDTTNLPKDLSLALGSGAITPYQLASGYTVFANGGYRVRPYFIDRVLDMEGNIIWQTTPDTVCSDCEVLPAAAATTATEEGPDADHPALTDGPANQQAASTVNAAQIKIAERVISAENAYLMTSMMRDVIRYGTGRRARVLNRRDIAGKTGTTNDQRDAWFAGFNPDVVTITWVGFDKTRSLGNRETGGRAALPMWINYMKEALAQRPEKILQRPAGLVSVRIDPDTGQLTDAGNPRAIFETFRTEFVPRRHSETKITQQQSDVHDQTADIPEQLF